MVLIDLFWGKKVSFQSFEMSISCSNILRQLKIPTELDEKTRVVIAGKSPEKTRAKLMFAILPDNFDTSRVILFV